MNVKILQTEFAASIVEFERDSLLHKIENEIERELLTWKAPWRQEALEHYLPLGWSFAAWEGEEGVSPLLGYFLAQPLLFFRGLTQSLWLEHLAGKNQNVKSDLLEIAYKTCREKHFQQLLISSEIEMGKVSLDGQIQGQDPAFSLIYTSKIVK